jgi:hypothetical protein
VKKLAVLAALCATTTAHAAQTGDLVRFVTCPVYRDTDSGKKSGCWLADDRATGHRWDVSQSPYKPDWNYAVLVEGRVSADTAQPCGAAVLDPVRTSRLDTPCTRHVIPAEGFPGRKFTLPRRNIAPSSVARPVPPGPYATRTFPVYFEFDRDFLVYQYDDWLIDNAVTWIRAAKPAKLVVTGFAATTPETVSGQTFAERPEVARERAEAIAETLRRLIPGLTVETQTQTAAQPTDDAEADGLPWQSQRRVEIRAEF